ncbi:hypothetical protein [Saccharibacillus sacchari]|uniref:Uncharacterized protein n=1 Tax=Saccharibacillus sacchari TaxID=456493 RepID=A0ACC6PAP4_9BACL
MIFYAIGLTLLGLLLLFLTPQFMGAAILIVIVFVVSVLNYMRTRQLQDDMREIRRHLGVMGEKEAAGYDIERQIDRVDELSDRERAEIDRRSEAELEQESRNRRP